MTHPSAPFGNGTIEGAFLDDIGYCFENDKEITVRADGREEQQIDACNLELERNQIGVKVMHGEEQPVVEMVYVLTVPVELIVRSGEDVIVDGYEATWTFDSVSVANAGPQSTTVKTKYIGKSYGDTDEPERFQ